MEHGCDLSLCHTDLPVLVGKSTLLTNSKERREEQSSRRRLADMVCVLRG